MKWNAGAVHVSQSQSREPTRTPGTPQKVLLRAVAYLCVLVVLGFFVATTVSAAPGQAFPSLIPLPNGFNPEGIAIGRGTQFFVGSIPTGAIYKGDLGTGQGALLVQPQANRAAVGLGYDPRTNYLFVAGGPKGAGYVYDAGTGASIASYQFTTETSFVNDVVVTRTGAFFTDSFRPVLYRIPLGPGGRIYPWATPDEIQLTGDFSFVPGAFNANGIDATPDGQWLIIVNTQVGTLYRVNPESGAATLIDLGTGSVSNGDGIYLAGRTLYVVRNSLNQIAVVTLNAHLTSGTIVRTITNPALDVPSTIDRFGDWLYAVNARFSTPATADTTYEVVQVPMK